MGVLSNGVQKNMGRVGAGQTRSDTDKMLPSFLFVKGSSRNCAELGVAQAMDSAWMDKSSH